MSISAVIPHEENQRWAWVKYQMGLRGYSFARLAREIGVHRSAPYLARRKPYPKMEKAIARVCGVPPNSIWPERYDARGRPNRPIGRPPKHSRHGNSLKRAAARGNGNRQERN